MRRLRAFHLVVPILCLFSATLLRGDVGSSIKGSSGGASITANNTWTATNKFTGQTDISGPDSTTNVEIGSTANDANGGTGGTNVVIGNNAICSNSCIGTVLVGSGTASITGNSQTVVGTGASSANNNGVVYGFGATTTGNPAIAIGVNASAGTHQTVIGSSITSGSQKDVFFGWGATTHAAAGTTPVNYTAPGGTGADNAGSSVSVSPGKGTGASAGGVLSLSRNLTLASSSTVQSQAPAYVACPTKILSNTSATAQTLATITTTSTTGGSVKMFFTTVANNGTLQDTDAGEIVIGWNNNAGTVAVAASAVYGQMDSDASGTLATTPTVTAATNVVSIKFTPTWVTIVPTTVTGFATFEVNGVNSIACQ